MRKRKPYMDAVDCPLHDAIIAGNYSKICSLLEADLENVINAKDRLYYTPLHYAVQHNHVNIVKLLLGKRANINEPNYLGHTPIELAAQNGNKEIVQILFDAGADCRYTGICPGYSALQLAAQAGRIEVIKYFLNLGTDADFRTDSGFTLLHIAARFGHCDLVALLLEKGANINNRTYHKGHTPLHFAVNANWPKVVDVLIREGADIEIKDNQGYSAFDLIFVKNSSEDGSKALIKYVLLRKRNYQPYFPVNYSFVRELADFWHDCQREVEKMNHCMIGNTSISLYKFLHDLFDDNKLVTYLYNNDIRLEMETPEKYFVEYPLYSNFPNIIKGRIQKGIIRKHVLDKADVLMDKILPQLPTESKFEIFSYLNIVDLVNFTKSFNSF